VIVFVLLVEVEENADMLYDDDSAAVTESLWLLQGRVLTFSLAVTLVCPCCTCS
jgi:hypothetical protein